MEGLSKNKIKEIRQLHQKKYRDESKTYLVEGEKMVSELLASHPAQLLYLIHTPASQLDFSGVTCPVYSCTNMQLEQASTMKHPNHVLAVVKQPEVGINASAFSIALDGIQDPGNLGTILRLADWYGIDQVLCSEDTVEAFNPKVVQASMGAIFRVAVNKINLTEYLSSYEGPIYGAMLDGESLYTAQLKPTGILVMGNEGNGVRSDVEVLFTHRITIPRFGAAESLNVGVATGILLSEFYRTV